MIKKIIKLIKKLFKSNEVFFVGSTDKLPAPLSKEEEIYYVEKSQNGDIKAKSKLIEHNLRLVVFLSKKYERSDRPLFIYCNFLSDSFDSTFPCINMRGLFRLFIVADRHKDDPTGADVQILFGFLCVNYTFRYICIFICTYS